MRVARGIGGGPSGSSGGIVLNRHQPLDEPLEAQREVLGDHAAEVAGAGHHALVPELARAASAMSGEWAATS